MSTMSTLPVTKMRVALFGEVILATTLAGCVVPPPVAPAQAPAATATSAPIATTVMATAAPAAMGTMVMLGENGELGKFLVDDKGMTLYLFTKDEKNVSNCYDKCEAAWPVLFTEGAPQAGEGVDAALLGTTTRKDGKTQVTYNGWPLYYYIKDMKAGDVTGQEVGDVWYVISPSGEMIEGAKAEAEGTMVKVAIKDFSFGAPVTIKVGTTVEWTNEDSAAHTVTAANDAFDSGNMNQNATFSFTFTEAGTFDYICTYHPNMKGQVVVTQ